MTMDLTMEEDEDVILPNSPIYEFFPEHFKDDEKHIVGSESAVSKKKFTIKSFVFDRCCNSMHWRVHDLKMLLSRYISYLLAKAWKSKCENYLQIFKNNNLFIPEDLNFLENTFTDVNELLNDERSYRLPLLMTTYLVPFFAVVLYVFSFFSTEYSYVNLINLTFVLIIICVVILTLRYYYKYLTIDSIVLETCVNINDLMRTLKKLYKVVHETEVIAQGFSSASISSATERIELSTLLSNTSKIRQLPELRRSLFTWMRNIYLQYRDATCFLIKTIPLSSEIASHYFATMSLGEFGDLLLCDPEKNYDQLLEISDNLSLASLKSMNELLIVQVSEFFKRFCLCFIHQGILTSRESYLFFNDFTKCIETLNTIKWQDKELLPLVKEAYILIRNMNSNSICAKQSNPIKSKTSPLESLGIVVHNFNLHLRMTLMKVIELEDIILAQDTEEILQENLHKCFLKNSVFLNDIESELTESSACLSECLKTVEKFTMVEPNCCEETKIMKPVNVTIQKKPEIIDDVDVIIEDEVFEAVVDRTELDSRQTYKAIHDEPKLNQNVSLPLIKELKKVLLPKAEEHRNREAKAMHAKAIKEGKPVPLSYDEDKNASGDEKVENDSTSTCFANDPQEKDDDLSGLIFNKPTDAGFAASIAAMALQRQQQFNLIGDTFGCSSSSDNDDDVNSS